MGDQPAGHLNVAGPSHIAQHRGIGMLNRHVQIGHEHLVLGHDINHPERQDAGVDVEHPEPGEVGYLVGDHLEQRREPVLDLDIGSVADRILRDQDHFLRARFHELADLTNDLDRPFADLPSLQ